MSAEQKTQFHLLKNSHILATTTLVLGAIPAIGWAFKIPLLYQPHVGWPEMVPETILMVLLAALLVWSERNPIISTRNFADQVFSKGISALLILIGLSTLGFYFFNWGTDLPYPLPLRPKPSSPRSALAFTFLGLAFFLSCWRPGVQKFQDLSVHLLVVPFSIAMLALTGYVSASAQFYSSQSGLGMSPLTAFCTVLLTVATLMGPLRHSYQGILYAEGTGGFVVRTLLPIVMLLPPLTSFLILSFSFSSSPPQPAAVAMLVLFPCLVLGIIIFYTAVRLEQAQERSIELRNEKQEITVAFKDYKAASLASRQLAAIVQSSRDAIISYDTEGILTSWNQGAESLFGYTTEEAIGISVERIANGCSEVLTKILRPPRATDEPLDLESSWRHKSGAMISVSFSISPIVDNTGEVIGSSCIVKDVSDLKKEIAERKQSQKELRKALQVKDDFIRTVSHELRTPLSVITGWVGLLEKNGMGAKQASDAYKVIGRNTGLLSRLIDDILDLSALKRNSLEIKRTQICLQDLVAETLNSIEASAATKQVEISTKFDSEPIWVSGDYDRLHQVFNNLLTNSVKFTTEGGHIHIGITQEDAEAVVTVADDGIGIDPEFLPFLFEGFSQSDSSLTRQFGGLGIGLTIAHALVKAHRGSLFATSEGIGKGAKFTLKLPRLAQNESSIQKSEASQTKVEPGRLEGIRALVVDDDPDILQLFRYFLEAAGAKVGVASNASSARSLLSEVKPQIILCDIGMPEENGISFIKKLRKSQKPWSNIPAIAVSAYATNIDRDKALEAGFEVHLSKPVNRESLIASICSLIDVK